MGVYSRGRLARPRMSTRPAPHDTCAFHQAIFPPSIRSASLPIPGALFGLLEHRAALDALNCRRLRLPASALVRVRSGFFNFLATQSIPGPLGGCPRINVNSPLIAS